MSNSQLFFFFYKSLTFPHFYTLCLQECEQPISEIKGSVVGFVMKEIALSILVCVEEEYREVEAPLQMVASALFCEEDKIESVLESSLPMKCAFQLKDDTVQQILVMEKEETSD